MEGLIKENYSKWLNSNYIDLKDREELKSVEKDEKEIEDRFYTNLSFGTGGMRGVRGIGTNRINKYVIRKATQGLSNYIMLKAGEEGKKKGVAIAYDCRIGSVEFALNAALVLAGNGIKAYLFEGLRSTPELSFAVRELGAQAGIVVTASHNPKEYNGYKVYWNDGAQIIEPQASGIVQAVNEVENFDDIKIMSEKEAKEKGLLVMIGKEIDDRFISEVEKQVIKKEIPGKSEFKIVYSPLHGTGRVPVQRVLKEMGFDSVYTVASQEMPDGNFPTCSYANPEDPAVFKLGIELADEVGATICMANDPDADRIGIAVKDKEGKWNYPNGNQVGLLLMNYILENKKDIPKNGAIISTIVSTPMLDVIAASKGVKIFRTLTGFKYIGEKIREFEEGKLDGTYLFGFEESYGYLIGTHARDKDAIVSTLLIAEMAAYYNSIGTSIPEELEKLYDKYGWYKEGIIAVTKKGKAGVEEINKIMNSLRDGNYKEIIGKKIKTIKDFKLSKELDIETGETKTIDLPSSDVIQFIFEDGTYITARPSGTEPKIKYYFCIIGKNSDEAEIKITNTMTEFEKFVDSLV
ncbi:MAG: phospho-sugar mutase [Cetobacterium sp.]|uniref:phospho-sugar mutase n=1 Tax=unclassified Cetobacterium TaxID=2630983 RepID=UPI00163C5BD2|nr:phospho-sugar mutase [Cetobacterium sp. 2A]MBC2856512.1 phospho-sugar mutase [Cetobacterium sp. 2A]